MYKRTFCTLFYYYKGMYISPTTVKEHYAKADPPQKEMMALDKEIAPLRETNTAVQMELKETQEEVATLRVGLRILCS